MIRTFTIRGIYEKKSFNLLCHLEPIGLRKLVSDTLGERLSQDIFKKPKHIRKIGLKRPIFVVFPFVNGF